MHKPAPDLTILSRPTSAIPQVCDWPSLWNQRSLSAPDPIHESILSDHPTLFARLLRLALIALLVWGAVVFCDWVIARVQTLPDASQGPVMFGLLLGTLLAYGALLAIPFVPGIEIGIMLLVLRGGEVALFVYLATLVGLSLAFLAGRYLPYPWLCRIALDLRLKRAAALLDQLALLSPERRLALLRQRLPNTIAPYVVQYRYLGLGLLLNLPGNALLGGGGGICLLAGLSHLFSTRGAILTIALAVAPVPLAVWYFGLELWAR